MAGKTILLVEGKDDEHVVKHLCGHHSLWLTEITPPREVGDDSAGIDSLLESLPERIVQGNVEALGIMVDADTNLAARWQALRDRLEKAGYKDLPVKPDAHGTIVEAPTDQPNDLVPRVGIWLMPDNTTNGILEDFLQLLVPSPSELLEHARASVDSIPGEPLFRAVDQPKALIHTWLAWQQEPGKPYGTAITAKYLDADAPQARTFVAWLRKLFFPAA